MCHADKTADEAAVTIRAGRERAEAQRLARQRVDDLLASVGHRRCRPPPINADAGPAVSTPSTWHPADLHPLVADEPHTSSRSAAPPDGSGLGCRP